MLADGRLLPKFAASRDHPGTRYTDVLLEDFTRLLGYLQMGCVGQVGALASFSRAD